MDKRLYLFGLIFLLSISSIYALTINSPLNNSQVFYNSTYSFNKSLFTSTSAYYQNVYFNETLVSGNNYDYITYSNNNLNAGAYNPGTSYTLVATYTFANNRSADGTISLGIYRQHHEEGNDVTAYAQIFYNDGTNSTTNTVTGTNPGLLPGFDCQVISITTNVSINKSISYIDIYAKQVFWGGWSFGTCSLSMKFENLSINKYLNIFNLYSIINNTGLYILNISSFNYTGGILESSILNVSLPFNSLLNISTQDYLANPISSFNFNLTDLTDNSSRYFSTSNYFILADIIRSRVYQLFFNVSSYSPTYINITEVSAYNSLLQTLYPANSLFLTIRDSSGNIITSPTSSVLVQGASGSYSASGSGSINLINLLPGNYNVFVNNANYSQGQLYLTVNSGSQLVNVYLLNGSSILFNTRDSAGNILSGVYCVGRSYVNGSLVMVMSGVSDISGKLQFTGAPGVYYDFNCSLSGYANTFLSFPQLLYSSYDVPMNVLASGNIQPSGYASFTPSTFKRGTNVQFSIKFLSPYSSFTNYSYIVFYPTGSINGQGFSSGGSTLNNSFNITNSGLVTVYYEWYLNNGAYQNFSQSFNVVNVLSNHTISSKQPNDYGLLIGDKVLRDSIILLSMMGMGWLAFGFFGSLASGGFTLMIILNTGQYTTNQQGIFIASAIIIVLLIIFRGRQ